MNIIQKLIAEHKRKKWLREKLADLQLNYLEK